MARDINNVTDDISLVMRELIDATENAIVLETAVQLHKGSKTNDPKEYVKKQNSNNREFNNKINKVVKKSQDIMFNVVDNVGSYTGTETSNLKKEINKGMKMVVASAKNMKKDTIKSVSRLDRYRKSSQFMPDIDRSIIQRTKKGIEKGLPVTYKNGRKVSYKAYMEMAVRTGIQQEIGDRQLETGGQANIVFWLVNEFEDCADDHASYQGKVYYDERYKNFKLKDQAKDMIENYIRSNNLLSIQEVRDKPPYLTTRPNCRHKMKPVGIDQVMNQSVENLKEQLGYRSRSYRPQNYEATKTQRYNERQIRGYKQKEQTFRELYNTTKNKDYLIEAQKAKRQTLLWQKRQRQHIANNPQLFRDYERETSKVLLQDLGLGKKIKVDPTKPPTPIINNPPQTPPKEDVPINETIKEHLEIPKENNAYLINKWETSKWKKKTPSAFNKREELYNKWLELATKEEEKESQNKETRDKVLFLYKNIQGVMPNLTISRVGNSEHYLPSRNTMEIGDIIKSKEKRKVITYTHEMGHAFEANILTDILKDKIDPNTVVGRRFEVGTLGSMVGENSDGSRTYRPNITGYMDEEKAKSYFTPNQKQLIDSSYDMKEAIVKEYGMKDRTNLNKWYDELKQKAPKTYALVDEYSNKYETLKEEKLEKYEVRLVEQQAEDWEKENAESIKDLDKQISKLFDDWLSRNISKDEYNEKRAELQKKRQNPFRKKYRDLILKAYDEADKESKIFKDQNASVRQLCDLFDSLSKGRLLDRNKISTGHGTKYYKQGVRYRTAEVFTHLMTINVHDPELYDIVKQEFPSIAEPFEKILDVAVENYEEGEE